MLLRKVGSDRAEGGSRAGLIVTSALMIWKGLILVTGSESPVRLSSCDRI